MDTNNPKCLIDALYKQMEEKSQISETDVINIVDETVRAGTHRSPCMRGRRASTGSYISSTWGKNCTGKQLAKGVKSFVWFTKACHHLLLNLQKWT